MRIDDPASYGFDTSATYTGVKLLPLSHLEGWHRFNPRYNPV